MAKTDLKKFEQPDESQFDLLLSEFDKLDAKTLMQINAEYLVLKPNSNYSFVFTGLSEFTAKDGNIVTVAKLVDKGRKNYICGAKVLVNTVKAVTQLPCLVKIITKNEEKSDKGKYIAMDIYTIPMELAKVEKEKESDIDFPPGN